MPRAEITLPSGAKVNIEGSLDEVRAIVEFCETIPEGLADRRASPRSAPRKVRLTSKRDAGPRALIRELKNEGFFRTSQSLRAVKEKLDEKGHIYPQTTLSSILIKLTKNEELVRKRDSGIWVYTSPSDEG